MLNHEDFALTDAEKAIQREKVMKRLKKIMALRDSSSPGEAAAAIHQANKLMESHGINEEEVALTEITEMDVSLTNCDVHMWENQLLGVIKAGLNVGIFMVKTIKTPGVNRSKAKASFVGTPQSVELAVYSFQTLRRQLNKDLGNAFLRILNPDNNSFISTKGLRIPKKWKEQYAIGWCQAIRSKLSDLVNDSKYSILIETYIQNKTSGKIGDVKKSCKDKKLGDIEKYFGGLGFEDGQDARLHRGVKCQVNELKQIGL